MPKTVLRNPGLVFKPFPFSPAVEANGIVWLSGHTGHVPGESVAVPGGIKAETRQVLENIGVTLHAIGLDYPDVVMATVLMTNMNEFAQMNEVYREFFAEDFPARVTSGVSRLASNYSIEIVVVAAR